MALDMETRPAIPKALLTALTQLYEIERKLKRVGDTANIERNLAKMKDAFSECGLVYEDPMNEPFNETRTDLDATIAGSGTENLVVVEVIKPTIRAIRSGGDRKLSWIVQRGIVIVESRKEQ